ncbi:peroxisome biogenesis factor 6 [Rhinophrynus dorsalis]
MSPVVSTFARNLGPLRLRVAPVDAESMVRAGRLQEVGGPFDRDAALWVSKKQLRELGLFHQEWVWVTLPLDDKMVGPTNETIDIPAVPAKTEALECTLGLQLTTEVQSPVMGLQVRSERKHLAVILAADLLWVHPHKYSHHLSISSIREVTPASASGCCTGRSAIISDTLLFNVTPGSGHVSKVSVEVTPGSSSVCDVLIERFSSGTLGGSRSALDQPPFAKELYIEIVKSPEYSSEWTYCQALYQHFQTPRAVQVGDILRISTLSHAEWLKDDPTMAVKCPNLYFRVSRIKGAGETQTCLGYLADTTHTNLYQEGSTHSFVPSVPSRDGHVFWSSLSPAGLAHAVDEICRILQPYLQDKNGVLGVGGQVLMIGPPASGKKTVVRAAGSRLNLHLYHVECATLCRESAAGAVTRLQSLFARLHDFRPCLLILSHVELLGRERDGSGEDSRVISSLCNLLRESQTQYRDLPLLIVATSSCPQDIPLDIQTCFLHEVSLHPPTEEQRSAMLSVLTMSLPLSRDINLAQLARRTAGFVLGDLCALLAMAGRNACTRTRRSCSLTEAEEEGLLVAGFPVIAQDLEEALAGLQDAQSQAVGAPKVPCVRWKDVGGLHDVKRQLLDTVQFPLDHPEVLAMGLRRSGVLLYGPPGTGKTLLAKAVATECAMTFLSVKGPELINMYVGQSEENVRRVFTRARAAAPCIVFFDELDSLAPNRGKSGDSGGVMDRVVSQLLAELDGLHSSNNVFVIGATNRPDLLDSALLRPGRFDKMLYVGVNEDRESQLRVLTAITRKFSLHPSVELSQVIEHCPPAVTGADLYALCADAMMRAIKEKVQGLECGQENPGSELVVCMEHFVQAADGLQPSVSPTELLRYERIRKQYSATEYLSVPQNVV